MSPKSASGSPGSNSAAASGSTPGTCAICATSWAPPTWYDSPTKTTATAWSRSGKRWTPWTNSFPGPRNGVRTSTPGYPARDACRGWYRYSTSSDTCWNSRTGCACSSWCCGPTSSTSTPTWSRSGRCAGCTWPCTRWPTNAGSGPKICDLAPPPISWLSGDVPTLYATKSARRSICRYLTTPRLTTSWPRWPAASTRRRPTENSPNACATKWNVTSASRRSRSTIARCTRCRSTPRKYWPRTSTSTGCWPARSARRPQCPANIRRRPWYA